MNTFLTFEPHAAFSAYVSIRNGLLSIIYMELAPNIFRLTQTMFDLLVTRKASKISSWTAYIVNIPFKIRHFSQFFASLNTDASLRAVISLP